MELKPGEKLGPYEVVSLIGAGGMGQVWKARDTRLGRVVAIKVSAEKFSDRFEREARAVAALNHPHICTLYDVGANYLVMEHVEGAEIRGPLPLEQTLKLAIQLAGALESAHRNGITHRDLKPANILTSKSGVKVLDFGLAKIEHTEDAVVEIEESLDKTLTISRALTNAGSVVGTLQYMAPEQVQGRHTDSRVDIFAFGCVLYEMLTGKRAFDGTSAVSVAAAILEREPPSVGAVAPPALDWVLRRCLEKDADERWQTARDLRAALERVAQGAAEHPERRPSKPVSAWVWAVAALFAVSTAALAFIHFREKPEAPPLTRFSIEAPPNGRFPGANGTAPAVSPDGREVVYEAVTADGKNQLWLRPFSSAVAQPLADTENGTFPFWSPDGKSIGFFATGKLRRLDIGGGAATTLADAPVGGGTWSPSGVIVFAESYAGPLVRVSDTGGVPRPATRVDANPQPQRSPCFLPDGRHFLYLDGSGQGRFAIRVGALDAKEDDQTLPDTADSSLVMYSQGYLLYLRASTLVARPFDASRRIFTGDAMPLAEQVWTFAAGNGFLLYRIGVSNYSLTWLDRSGKQLGTWGEEGSLRLVALSPDGKRAAVTIRDASTGNVDIWLFEGSDGQRTRFTSDPATDAFPVWSPDGRYIVFRSNRSGQFDLYRKATDGSGSEELLYADGLAKVPSSISPDGRNLAYWTQDSKNENQIAILPNLPAPGGRPGHPFPFMKSESRVDNSRFSPDGHWIAFQSDESGRYEVYVAPFPGPGGKRPVSTSGGMAPLWRPDGKELFYRGRDGHMKAAELQLKADAFEVKATETLFAPQLMNPGDYDVSADGQRFLMLAAPPGELTSPLTVVQNWTEGLKK